MGLTVKVQFPEGIREVPAYVHVNWGGDDFGSSRPDDMSVITPYDIDGWEFRHLIGDPQWHAFQVPTRQQQRWGEDLPHSIFCDDHSHYR